MKKFVLTTFILLITSLGSYADRAFWVSSSVIWGQGNIGGAYRFEDGLSISFSEYFVWDWDDKEIDYHSERLSMSVDNWAWGIAFKTDRTIDADRETAPFISTWHMYKDLDLYHKLEHRHKNLLGIDNYLRYQIDVSYDFAEYKEYDFFVKSSSFFNLDEVDLEKQLFYIGIKRVDPRATLSLYVIPYKYGTLGQEWDDIKYIGGSFVYRF